MFTHSQRNPMRIENKLSMDSRPRATRENSRRQQPRKLRLDTKKKKKKKKHTSHKQQRTDENMPKGDGNREQYRSPDKSHGTMGRQ